MNILLVEDHISVREGVEFYLKQNIPNVENIYTSSNGEEALHKLNNTEFIDVIITDLNMPIMNGFDFLKKVDQLYPTKKKMVFTMYYNSGILEKLNRFNIDALLCKNASLKEFNRAFEALASNSSFKSSEILKNLEEDNRDNKVLDENFAKVFLISPRESEVLVHLANNLSNVEIADQLHLSKETIKGHRKNIYRKLGVNNVLDLYKLLLANNYFNQENDPQL